MIKKQIKILVTGGAGNIGTNLCKELSLRGHKVISSDLYNTERDDYIRCDVRNFCQLNMVFEEFGPFDFVYHLAAEYGRWNGEAYYENLWQTNNVGTKHILKFQEKYEYSVWSPAFVKEISKYKFKKNLIKSYTWPKVIQQFNSRFLNIKYFFNKGYIFMVFRYFDVFYLIKLMLKKYLFKF